MKHPRPTPGRIVWYQTDGRNYDYYLPAIVTVTLDNLVPDAALNGEIPSISSFTHCHLWVPGGKEPYYEYDVPFDDGSFGSRGRPHPRSWRWPARSLSDNAASFDPFYTDH